MWEPPAADVEEKSDLPPPALEKMLGLKNVVYTQKEAVKHVLSHRKMDVAVFAAVAKKITFVPTDEYDDARWVAPEALAQLPTSALCKKILMAAGWPAFLAQPSSRVTSSKPTSSKRRPRPRKRSR
jgi:hypothetical protein